VSRPVEVVVLVDIISILAASQSTTDADPTAHTYSTSSSHYHHHYDYYYYYYYYCILDHHTRGEEKGGDTHYYYSHYYYYYYYYYHYYYSSPGPSMIASFAAVFKKASDSLGGTSDAVASVRQVTSSMVSSWPSMVTPSSSSRRSSCSRSRSISWIIDF